MTTFIKQFPQQKLLMSKKTEEWGIECIEAALGIITHDTSKIRKTKAAKKINYDLANGIINEDDIENAFNPMGIRGVQFPAKIQNYPIELSKFNVLKGEEAKRRFDWRVRVVNEDAVSSKEEQLREQIHSLIISELQNPEYSEEQAARRFKELSHYQEYEFGDLNEVMASRVLSYFWHTQKLRTTFSDSFYDVLIGAEETFAVDIIHNDPVISKRNTLNISTFGSGEDYQIEKSDIIVEDGYRSVGSVIDDFWDVLSEDEVDVIEEGARTRTNASEIVLAGPEDPRERTIDYSSTQLITVDGRTGVWGYGGAFDDDGNLRVSRVVWRSRRKMGDLKYFDENGDEQHTFIDENFPVSDYKDRGWEAEWHWVNEWWQGYKIGHDIYVKIEPLPRIGSTMNNPSYSMPPYVGTVFNINSSEGVSLMDRIKPYKYLYNIYMRRTELASARNKGVIAELDLAMIPDGWDEELVMMYAEANGYMITDSFKEGSKGQSMGKLVSTVRQRGLDVINLSSANVIKANLELAMYVKNELAEISGVSPQREGQISNRETLGGVERSVTQSSHITEEWFRLHDNTKIRVMELILETAKYCWRNLTGEHAQKLQYVDDGLMSHMFQVDGKIFNETDYGLYISNSANDAELVSAIKQLTQAALQNDKANLSDIISIYRDTSVSSMARKLEHAENKRNEREDKAREEDQKAAERQQQAMIKFEQMKMEQEEKKEMRIEILKIEGAITMKEMDLLAEIQKAEIQGDLADKDTANKLKADIEKLKLQLEYKYKELAEKSEQFDRKLGQDKMLKEKDIAAKKKPVLAKT